MRSNGAVGASKSSLANWLASLDEATLARVLANRPEVLRGPQPRTLDELADRLQHQNAVFAALVTLNLPALQAVEALLALGGDATIDELAALLDPGAEDQTAHRAHVEHAVGDLAERALVWPHAGRVRAAPTLHTAFPTPLELGAPARVALGERTVAELQQLQRALGLPATTGNKPSLVDALAQRLADGDFVRARAALLPPDARAWLDRRAHEEPDDDWEVYFDPRTYGARRTAEDAAAGVGLLLRAAWSGQTVLLAEVARALRGEDYRAPFTPRRPEPVLPPADAGAVRREAAASLGQFAELSAAVLDHVRGSPVACLKSGGIGSRELTRLGKAVQAPDQAVRLILELAGATGLVVASDAALRTATGFDDWRAQEPAERMLPLLRTWWELPATPTTTRDADGKLRPALSRMQLCALCRDGRRALADALAGLPDGRGFAADDVLTAVWWSRPALHLTVAEDGVPLAWREAELLGVVAHGALTPVGRALRDGDPDALGARLTDLLPASAHSASFGSDLTVLVSGAPSAAISALLDACADRESRGSGTVWRFTPASVRAALDAGRTASELEAELSAIATGELPQPLRYLIGDVGRRHGHLRVAAAVSCVRSDDEALLAEVAAHRSLRRLGLRLLAPTVLASNAPVSDTLAALRAAGYLPVAEGPDGELRLQRAGPAGAARQPSPSADRRPGVLRPLRPATPARDPARVAHDLLTGAGPAQDEPSRTELMLSEYATALGPAEVRQLAHAIDSGRPILIEYRSATGGQTSRVVSELDLDPPYLTGWCHLREDERVFSLAGIRSATAV